MRVGVGLSQALKSVRSDFSFLDFTDFKFVFQTLTKWKTSKSHLEDVTKSHLQKPSLTNKQNVIASRRFLQLNTIDPSRKNFQPATILFGLKERVVVILEIRVRLDDLFEFGIILLLNRSW